MQVHFGVDLLQPEWSQSIVCIGTFDGVHLGHQALIAASKERAAELGVPLALVTFDRHPAVTLMPDKAPEEIGSLGQNLMALRSFGIDLAVVLAFDHALAQTAASDFFQSILIDRLRAAGVVVGHDFAFGKGREGTFDWLSARIETRQIPAYEVDGLRVSSTAIRQAIVQGDLVLAAKLMGRLWSLEGIVVTGEQVGRTLGFPTANVARSRRQVVPGNGIYAGWARTPFGQFAAAISVGHRPTFGEHHRTIEAYLLDYPGHSLYGHSVEVAFTTKVRDELKFDSVDALVEQMHDDVAQIRAILAEPERTLATP